MKKLLSLLLVCIMVMSCANISAVFAEAKTNVSVKDGEALDEVLDTYNLIPAKDSTFESGTTTWSVMSSGSVQVESNPDGTGKVLSYAGYNAGIYASKTWFYYQLDYSQISKYDIWVAHYASSTDFQYHYDIWQYTGTGTCAGVAGAVDMNIGYTAY